MSEELLNEEPVAPVPSEDESETTSDSGTDTTEAVAAEELPEGGESEQPKKKDGFERRIERFERKLEATSQELEYWKKQAMSATPQAPVSTTPTSAPKLSDYNDIDAWAAARDAFVEQQLIAKLAAQTQVTQKVGGYQSKEVAFKAATPDFEHTMLEFQEDYRNVAAPDVAEFALESDVGPQLWYYLATHRDETDRLLKLSPVRRLGELGKIEAKLQGTTAAPGKQVSSAPAPVKPAAGVKTVAKKIDDPDLDHAEYIRMRQAQKARR